jgi:hypothetical protein
MDWHQRLGPAPEPPPPHTLETGSVGDIMLKYCGYSHLENVRLCRWVLAFGRKEVPQNLLGIKLTPADMYHTTRRHIPEGNHFPNTLPFAVERRSAVASFSLGPLSLSH